MYLYEKQRFWKVWPVMAFGDGVVTIINLRTGWFVFVISIVLEIAAGVLFPRYVDFPQVPWYAKVFVIGLMWVLGPILIIMAQVVTEQAYKLSQFHGDMVNMGYRWLFWFLTLGMIFIALL